MIEAEAPILWLSHAKSGLTGKEERSRAREGGGNRRRDSWMASPTHWT